MPAAPLFLRVTLGGHESAGTVALHADRAVFVSDAGSHALELYDPLAHSQDTQGEHGGGLTAPMPGKIISIAVKAGDTVEKGQPLLVMEAMKMEHTISAPADGKVAEVFYAIGDQVTEGAELVAIEKSRRRGERAMWPPRRAALPARWRDSATINVKAGVTGARRGMAVILWSAVVRHRRSGQHAMPKSLPFPSRRRHGGAPGPAKAAFPAGAPSYVIFGAYLPRWLLAGLIGIVAALVAHRLFVAGQGLERQAAPATVRVLRHRHGRGRPVLTLATR